MTMTPEEIRIEIDQAARRRVEMLHHREAEVDRKLKEIQSLWDVMGIIDIYAREELWTGDIMIRVRRSRMVAAPDPNRITRDSVTITKVQDV